MDTLNNPAARLLALLQKAKGDPQLRKQDAMRAWASLLGVTDGNQPLILRRFGGVMELPMQIKERISSLPDIDDALYLRWLPKIVSAFNASHLGGGFSNFVDAIDETTLYGIELCASTLGKRDPDPVIEPADLEDISKQVDELLTEVRDSAVDAEVRLFILKHLYTLRKAIDEYQLFGAKPLSAVIGEAIGSVVTEPLTASKVSNTTQGQRLWKLVKRVGLVFHTADGVGKLADRVVKLLE